MIDDNTEIELKLEVAERDMERIRRHPLIRQTKKGRATTKTLKSVYFDTPDFLLFSGGASLRVRHSAAAAFRTSSRAAETAEPDFSHARNGSATSAATPPTATPSWRRASPVCSAAPA